MDRASEIWKRFPVLVVGDLPSLPPGALSLPAGTLGTAGAPDINNFYLVLALPESQIAEELTRLTQAGATPDQVLVLLPAGRPAGETLLPFHGVADLIEGENAEELRARLLGRLEVQRQKKLMFMLHAAAEAGLARRWSETELQRVLDATRVAHALCCAYGLPPGPHGRVLEACLAGPVDAPSVAWPADVSLERLLHETAGFVADRACRDGGFREALRERAAALPFRARNDLLHAVENALGPVTGGSRHAA